MYGTLNNYKNLTDSEQILSALSSMHLQWFGADEEGRTEDASEHKIKKAKEEGKVAKSQDLSSAIVLLLSCACLMFFASEMFFASAEMVKYFMRESALIVTSKGFEDKNFDITVIVYFFKILGPLFAIGVFSAILGNVVQVGFMLSPKAIKVDFKKIAPDFPKYIKNKIFSMDAVYNLLKSLFKVGVVGLFTYWNIAGTFDTLMNTMNTSLKSSFLLLGNSILVMFLQIGAVFLVMGIVDFFMQKRMFLESQKMTKQEVKEERKTFEGDPLIKSRLKQRMREIMSQNIGKLVPQADVLVVNPTHFAVALQYKRDSMNAPKVIAKGQDNMALKMKEIARDNKVPIMENKYLARALYHEVEIDEEIPEKYYEAVVIILREVYRIRKAKF